MYPFNSDVRFGRDVNIIRNTTVGGTLNVTGDSTMSNLTVTGTLNATVDLTGKTITPAVVNASGNVSVGGTLDVTGATTMTDLTVTGTLTADIDFTGKDISAKSVTTSAGVTVGGALNVTGDSTMTNLTVTGTLNATVDLSGKTITPAVVNASGNVSVGGTLTVTGKTTMANADVNALLVKGAVQFVKKTDTYAASWTPDFDASNILSMDVTGDLTINAPTHATASQAGSWYMYLKQDSTGNHTVTFNSAYKIASGDISTTANVQNIVLVVASGDGVYDVFITQRGA